MRTTFDLFDAHRAARLGTPPAITNPTYFTHDKYLHALDRLRYVDVAPFSTFELGAWGPERALQHTAQLTCTRGSG